LVITTKRLPNNIMTTPFKPKRVVEMDELVALSPSDYLYVVDVSDTTDNPSGTGKKVLASNLPGYSGTTDASTITSGTLSNARLSSSVTLEGNTFNSASQLVKLNASTQLPAVSGINLTNLNGSNITSGTVPNSRLSTSVTLQGNTFNGINQLVQLNASAQLPPLNGSLLTSLNANEISSGTLADARLSPNVMFKIKLINNIAISGNTILSQALTDNWFVTSHPSGIVTFTLSDSPTNDPGTHFRIMTNSNQAVHIVTGPATTIYYFMGVVNPGTSFTPTAQRGRVIDLYCIAANTFMMTGDIV
jgi:hypothetical protein